MNQQVLDEILAACVLANQYRLKAEQWDSKRAYQLGRYFRAEATAAAAKAERLARKAGL